MIKSDNNINNTMWLLQMKQINVDYTPNWTNIIEQIVELITNKMNYTTKNCAILIKELRELLYILFITNIDFHIIIRKIMLILVNKYNQIILITESTSHESCQLYSLNLKLKVHRK